MHLYIGITFYSKRSQSSVVGNSDAQQGAVLLIDDPL